LDVTTRIKRTQLFGSILIDDIQVDRSTAGDKEPRPTDLRWARKAALPALDGRPSTRE